MLKPAVSIVNGINIQSIDVLNRGLAFGDGVFETMRVMDGAIPLIHLHKARLLRGLHALRLNYSAANLSNDIDTLLAQVKQQGICSGRAKWIVSRASGGQGVIPSDSSGVDVVLLFYPSDISGWIQSSVKLMTGNVRLPRNANLAGLKHLNRLDYVLAAQQSNMNVGQHLLLMDTAENVIETLHHNVFFIQSDAILTPSLKSSGVQGVFKAFLTEKVLPSLGVLVVEKDITLAEAEQCEACFITNAYSGITPVNRLRDVDYSESSVLNDIGIEVNNLLVRPL